MYLHGLQNSLNTTHDSSLIHIIIIFVNSCNLFYLQGSMYVLGTFFLGKWGVYQMDYIRMEVSD